MPAVVIDGKALAEKVKGAVRAQVSQREQPPGLAVILVGNDPASRVYVNGKKADCAACGIYSEEHPLPEDTTQQALLALIAQLNERADIHGILVQLPLPRHIDERQVLLAIHPDKDVDCFHPLNVGEMVLGKGTFQPCTPAGIMRMLAEYGISPAGKHCVVVGRSDIVGKPVALLMLQRDATVTICHSKTASLKQECLRGDIIIAATGRAGLITADMVKEGAVVVDVGMNRNHEGKLCGDVDYQAVAQRAAYITPVPGGVGPMTRAMLMENTLRASL